MFRRAKPSALEQGLEKARQAKEAVAQRRWFEGFESATLAAELLLAATKDPANKSRVPQLKASITQMLQLAEDAKKGQSEAGAAQPAARPAADDESAHAMHLAQSPHARMASPAATGTTNEEEGVPQGAPSDHERAVAYARQSDGHPQVALYTTGQGMHGIPNDCERTPSLSLHGSVSACP